MDSDLDVRTRHLVEATLPLDPHRGFERRYGENVHQLRAQLIGAVVTTEAVGESTSLQNRLSVIGEQYKKALTAHAALQSLDNYLHNHPWRYKGERQEEHQEEALRDVLTGIADGHWEGHIDAATSTGKNYEIAKLAEAFYLGGLRVLVLSHTNTIASQNRHGKIINGQPDGGLAKFAPHIPVSHIGEQYNKSRARASDRVVVSTYQSLNYFAKTGELGEFDVILADECHRSLGQVTAETMRNFSPHAVKIGFTASPDFGLNKSVNELFPYKYHHLPLLTSIERGLTAPIQPMVFATGAEIPNLDPHHPDFTPRELWRLATMKSRNALAVSLAKNFVEEGRQGLISCVPGEDMTHARLLADQLNRETITDPKTGETRPVRAQAVGNFLGDELRNVLIEYEQGNIDVLTYVKAIGEGWDSQVASFTINSCPTTSLVKRIQDVGRVMRRKANGMHSIAVDMVDEAIGKEQKTVLHVLGQEEVNLGKVYSGEQWNLGMDSYTYLRGLLYDDLYDRLVAADGLLLSDLILKPREKQRPRLKAYYEKILEKEGLGEKPPHMMGVPKKVLDAINEFEDESVELYERLPTQDELLDHLVAIKALPLKDQKYIFRGILAARKIIAGGAMRRIIDDGETEYGGDPAQIYENTGGLKEALADAIIGLNEAERRVIITSYLAPDGEIHTHNDVGDTLGLTGGRIWQIKQRAFAKMRTDTLWAWTNPDRDKPGRRSDNIQEPQSTTEAEALKFDFSQPGRLLTKQEYEELSPRDQYIYTWLLAQKVREINEYADVKDPMIHRIANVFRKHVNYFSGSVAAEKVIQTAFDRPELRNNWSLRRQCLNRFNTYLESKEIEAEINELHTLSYMYSEDNLTRYRILQGQFAAALHSAINETLAELNPKAD